MLGAPVWLSSLILMALLTATNLVSVKSYGEFEFWFASIKVAAIVAWGGDLRVRRRRDRDDRGGAPASSSSTSCRSS
jgi:hypothetical protein